MAPYPFPEDEYCRAVQLICERADAVDSHEANAVKRVAAERKRQWASWERTGWDANPAPWGDPKQGAHAILGEHCLISTVKPPFGMFPRA